MRRRLGKQAIREARQEQAIERIPIAVQELLEQVDRFRELGLWPRVGFLADSNRIENQQVDIIDAFDENRYDINFKLTAEHYEIVALKLQQLEKQGKVTAGAIQYGKKNDENLHTLAEAWQIQADNTVIKIAKDRQVKDHCGSAGCTIDHGYTEAPRSALGLVQIEIPKSNTLTPHELGKKINELLISFLDIPDGIASPEMKAEREYKKARYVWHHKLNSAEAVPQWETIEGRLRREQVFPGYFTISETGKHKEYEDISPFAVYHTIYDVASVTKIIKAGGLIATHERYRRGLLSSGMSSAQDLRVGGADSVFTRIVPEAPFKHTASPNIDQDKPTLVFNNDILDRTDWYAYKSDQFGKTEPSTFKDRQSPREVFTSQQDTFWGCNEQMFRLGIPLEKIKAIVCYDTGWQSTLREECKRYGVEHIDGVPVHEFLKLDPERIEAIQAKLGASDVRYIGGESIEDFRKRESEAAKVSVLKKYLDEKQWAAVKARGNFTDMDTFLKQEQAVIINEFMAAGFDGFGDWRDIQGHSVLYNWLSGVGIYQIDGKILDVFLYDTPYSMDEKREKIEQEFKKRGIKIPPRYSFQTVFNDVDRGIRSRLRSLLRQRLNDQGRTAAASELYYIENWESMKNILDKYMISTLGGLRVDTIEPDARDRILADLCKQGITEINGKPIDEFVVYAKKVTDLIDIAHDRPPRSATSA